MSQIKVKLSNGQIIEIEDEKFTTIRSDSDGVTIEFEHKEGKSIRASKAFALDGPYDPYQVR